MDLNLKNKVALVTGSSRGIGLGIAEALREEGCHVVLNGRDETTLQAAARRMGCLAVAADMTSPEGCKKVLDMIVDARGRLDLLVCNIGSGRSVPPGEETAAEWERVFRINFLSTVYTVDAARPVLQKGGAILCISSICGSERLGAPLTYSCAKAALNAYVTGMAVPLARDGIRINAVAPGNILFAGSTWEKKLEENPGAVHEMLERHVPLRRLGAPEDIAALCAFLLSDRSSFVTGALYAVDGGQLRSFH